MIRNWFKKAGFDVGVPVEVPVDPNDGLDRCTLPSNSTFLRREHVFVLTRQAKCGEKRKCEAKSGTDMMRTMKLMATW